MSGDPRHLSAKPRLAQLLAELGALLLVVGLWIGLSG